MVSAVVRSPVSTQKNPKFQNFFGFQILQNENVFQDILSSCFDHKDVHSKLKKLTKMHFSRSSVTDVF